MFYSNFIIFQCIICARALFIASKSPENSSIASTLMTELLTKCNLFTPQFVIAISNTDHNIKKMFSTIKPTSLLLYNDKIMEKSITNDEIIISIQPNIFIINTETENYLNKTINSLKLSPWWNIKSFYAIQSLINTKNCPNAFNYLWLMWKMDLINAIFICRNDNNQISMFTYNPFTNRGPNNWKIIQIAEIHRPWTLLTHQYQKNSSDSICSLLNFDKTEKLDGYDGIHAAAFQSGGMTTLNADDDAVSRMLFDTLNLTRNYIVDKDRGYVDGGGIPYGMIKNLTTGNYDIIINSRYPAYAKGVKMSTIISQSGLAIVSQPRGYVPIVRKIIDYFPFWFFISIFILVIATAFVLKYSSVNLSFAAAMTEVTGLFFDSNILTIPKSISSRIFLFVILFFALIIQTLFRGRILAFLTIPIPERNVDTFEDLIEFKDYNIICDLGMRKFVHPQLKDRCLNISAPVGMKELLTDSQTCFISDKYIIIRFMAQLKSYWLHLSRDRVIKQYGIFMMRENWPLADRIAQGISRMFETDLSCLVYRRVYGDQTRRIKMIENRHLIRRFRALYLTDLTFAFEIWSIGIIFSLTVFIIEMQNHLLQYCRYLFKM